MKTLKLAIALAAAATLSACGEEPAPAPAPAPVAAAPVAPPPPLPTMTEAQVQAALAAIEAATAKHDIDALGALFAEDAKFTVTPYQMPTQGHAKAEYLEWLRKQFGKNAGARESSNVLKLAMRTDGTQATARLAAESVLDVNGYPLAQKFEHFYTFELRGDEVKVISLVTHGKGVSAGGFAN